VDVDNAELCQTKLNRKELQQFRNAVKNEYYFEASGVAGQGWQPAVVAGLPSQCMETQSLGMPLLTLLQLFHKKKGKQWRLMQGD
jgi:hypothetical protein